MVQNKVTDSVVPAALEACLGARFAGTRFRVTVVRYRGVGMPWINAYWSGGFSWFAVARFVESLEGEAKKMPGMRKALLLAGSEKSGFSVVAPASSVPAPKSSMPVSNVCFAYEYFGLFRTGKRAKNG